ncbi:MAG TPA: PD-(D/E)XK nuclease family protein [Anaerolineae bacterium]|nr:PD-(D/E)XK nuclease family protein [Anaerolineae bacterium]HQH38059.1 PD-(D/E)XK nuclease family protein [Anaerolineae bacterium]
MPTHLYLAPAASGKTTYLVAQARALSAGLTATLRVVVPTQLQVRAWQRRLAETGGALGVRVGTFDTLYREILRAAGEVYVLLTEPIQYRLLRALIADAPLQHFAPLRTRPGFAQVVQGFVRELKAGGVSPDAFADAVKSMGGEPRLLELAQLYTAYQERLQHEGWADFAGLGWLTAEALVRHPDVGRDWSHLFVDGFDDLTSVQVDVLRHLAGRVGELVITLTGSPGDDGRTLIQHRFDRTRRRLETALGITAEPLPARVTPDPRVPALRHLEAALFTTDAAQCPTGDAVVLIAAPDREAEVRAALRWLKTRVVRERLRLSDVALLARDIEPYRPFIQQTADEFGVPVHILDGLPLRANPAVAALLDLLRLALPDEASSAFPWRLTVEAWRSPYFEWTACGITSETAESLDRLARWGRVVAGLAQWEEAFALAINAGPRDVLDEEQADVDIPLTVPTGAAAEALLATFHCFVQRITPPQGPHPCRTFVAWIESLIGDDAPPEDEATSPDDLGVVRQILAGPVTLRERDLAALNVIKDVLRGLVWADEAVVCDPAPFPAFWTDLEGAVDAATYRLPLPTDREALLVADVTQARGVPFHTVAVLGLAEGEFPAALAEDPFLRDADRRTLRDDFGLSLSPSPDSSEAEYFYEAIARPRAALLLTRPRIADNGAPWQASPYWDEVRRRVAVTPLHLTSHSYPAPDEAASWEELLLGLSAQGDTPAWEAMARRQPEYHAALERATRVLAQRLGTITPGLFDGDLTSTSDIFAQRFGPARTWSASRLESYRECPFRFFVGSVLALEPRARPVEGLDAAQLGSLYHHIFEQLYQAVADPTDLEQLLATLPSVATPILDVAPREQQFRPTAWWARTRDEIIENVRRSLVALDASREDFVPSVYEARFGLDDHHPPLVIRDSADSFRLRGLIDRVDRAPDGRVRIIDYKTGGKGSFTVTNVKKGKKLQLPLYALAAQEALDLGTVSDGFYWHIQAAEASSFTLAKFADKEENLFGPAGAMHTAVTHAWEAVHGARQGHFVPTPPDGGCPAYCPAAAFCWHYQPKQW